MEEKKASTISLAPDSVKELVSTKESLPLPPKKTRLLPWLVLGIGISLVLGGIGLLVLKYISSRSEPDIVIEAPSSVRTSPSQTPSQTGETSPLVNKELLFENKPYQNELAKFQISVPLGWEIDDSGKSGSIVVLVDPKTVMASGSAMLTFVNVATSRVYSPTLDKYIESAREGLKKSFTSYVIEEDKDMLLNGQTFHLIGGSYMAHGIKMRNRNLLVVVNLRGYAISATAPESVWSKKELLLNATLFSFKTL